MGKKSLSVADSMRAAASMWKLSITEIKRAKNGGCKAFYGSKVYRDVLLGWLKSNPPKPIGDGGGEGTIDAETADELKRQKLIREVARLDISIKAENHKLELAKERVVSKALVQDEWARGVAIIFEEAKGLMEKDHYAVFVSRVKAKIKMD